MAEVVGEGHLDLEGLGQVGVDQDVGARILARNVGLRAVHPDPLVRVGGVPIASILTDIAITPDGAIAYVTSPGVDQVFEIELATNTVTASVPVQNGPVDVAITPGGAFAYVFAQRACRSPVELITASLPLERQGPRPVQPC